MPPNKIGRYEIVEELGRGAMGVVYRGFDPNIGRPVAIKTVFLESGDPETLKRFRREAQAAGILSFPNIVTIYDAGEDNGVFYIAMELVEGETLQRVMAQGPLPVDRAISILEQVGAALEHAHSRQIIHRDIKPANIIVSQGSVKVTDFGVAKITTHNMTSTGQVLGTPAYVAPEVLQGAPADQRSDIFSAGVLLYEMLTGAAPFAAESLPTVMYKILLHDPPAPSIVNPSLPPGLDFVVFKALAKNPEDRYQDCAALLADLRNHQALTGRSAPVGAAAAPAPSASPSEVPLDRKENRKEVGGTQAEPEGLGGWATTGRRRKASLAALAAVIVALAAGLLWQSRRPPAPPRGADQPATAPFEATPAPTTTAPVPPAPQVQPLPPPEKPPAPVAPSVPKASSPGAPSSRATRSSRQQPAPPQTTPSVPAVMGLLGRVVIHSEPEGARILVNGKPTSYRTPVNFGLPPGTHQITVERQGFTSETRDVEVHSNQTTQVRLELLPTGERRRRLLPFR